MSSISTCPDCQRQVSLPHGYDPRTRVRCPLCHAEYTLETALAHRPPALIVLEAVLEENSTANVSPSDLSAHGSFGMTADFSAAPTDALPPDIPDENVLGGPVEGGLEPPLADPNASPDFAATSADESQPAWPETGSMEPGAQTAAVAETLDWEPRTDQLDQLSAPADGTFPQAVAETVDWNDVRTAADRPAGFDAIPPLPEAADLADASALGDEGDHSSIAPSDASEEATADDAMTSEGAPAATGVIAPPTDEGTPDLASGNQPRFDFDLADSGPPAFNFEAGGAATASDGVDLGGTTFQPRKRKGSPNMGLEMAKAVVGGAVGLFIANLILLWFGRDLLGIGPYLPRWSVPQSVEAPLE